MPSAVRTMFAGERAWSADAVRGRTTAAAASVTAKPSAIRVMDMVCSFRITERSMGQMQVDRNACGSQRVCAGSVHGNNADVACFSRQDPGPQRLFGRSHVTPTDGPIVAHQY